MEKRTTYCNLCGKEFDEVDRSENFHIHKLLGYGTRFDMQELTLDICCGCMERLIDSCEISPVDEPESIFKAGKAAPSSTTTATSGVVWVESIPYPVHGKIRRKGKRMP